MISTLHTTNSSITTIIICERQPTTIYLCRTFNGRCSILPELFSRLILIVAFAQKSFDFRPFAWSISSE
jgi:hypothetical protein